MLIYVCVCALSLHREFSNMILEDKSIISELILLHLFSAVLTEPSVLILMNSPSGGRHPCPGRTTCCHGNSKRASASLVAFTEKTGSVCSSSCFHLLRECQIDHITMTIFTRSQSENCWSQRISLAQVWGCSRGRWTSNQFPASSQNLLAWEHLIRACIKSSSIAKQILHLLDSLMYRRLRVHSSGRIPRKTCHQKILTFGTTFNFHKDVHICCSFSEVPIIVPSSRAARSF
jgi:hypothetical protein